jgi:hypothetical protein
MSNAKHLIAVEAGTEIFSSNGELNVDTWGCTM